MKLREGIVYLIVKFTFVSILFSLLFTTIVFAEDYQQHLNEFTTDGCSMFIDKDYLLDDSWAHCCIQHDVRYFGGGSKIERKDADIELKKCIADVGESSESSYKKFHYDVLSKIVYSGVRTGGASFSLMWYRWGYGWKEKRYKSRPLTALERQIVDEATKDVDIYDLDQIKTVVY